MGEQRDESVLKHLPLSFSCWLIHCSPPVCPSCFKNTIQIMTERKNAKAMAGGSLQDRMQAGLDLPLQGRLHAAHINLLCANLWAVEGPYQKAAGNVKYMFVIISMAYILYIISMRVLNLVVHPVLLLQNEGKLQTKEHRAFSQFVSKLI